jgi:hypothetical protein
MAGRIVQADAEWDAVLSRLRALGLYDVFYEAAYSALYAKEGDAVEAFVYEEGADVLFFPYLKRSIPGEDSVYDFETAYGYGGPLSSSEDAAFLARAWGAFAELAREAGMIAGVVRFHPVLETQKFADGEVLSVRPIANAVAIDVARDWDDIEAGFKKDHRRVVRKAAEDSQIAFREVGNDDAAWEQFAVLYTQRMEDLDAAEMYYFDAAYFAGLRALGPDMCRLYGAFYGDDLMAAAVAFCAGDIWHYHLAASNGDYLQHAPNNVLIDGLARAAHEGGAQRLFLGGGRGAAEDDPLLRFKKSFAPADFHIAIGACVLDEARYGDVCTSWEAANPDKVSRYAAYVLKYRY